MATPQQWFSTLKKKKERKKWHISVVIYKSLSITFRPDFQALIIYMNDIMFIKLNITWFTKWQEKVHDAYQDGNKE